MAKIKLTTETTHLSKHDVAHMDGTFVSVLDQEPLTVQPNEFNLDNFVGYTYRGKDILDLDGVVGQIDSGNAQKITKNNTITYTFLKEGQDLISIYNNPNYGFTAGTGVSAFRPDQIEFAREAVGLWDELIAPEFRETNGRGADIQFANSWDPAQAYAYYPSEKGGYKYLGDVFVADAKSYYENGAPEGEWTFDAAGNLVYTGDDLVYEGNFSNAVLDFGGYGQTTIVHELGHTLGLSHPGAYNGAGATTYTDQAEYAQDSEQYTIMSYWSASETGARIVDWGTFFFNNEQTPLLHDIYVAQQKYGAEMDTRTGDTTYGFNANVDKDVYDFSINDFPYLTIWDAGGEDTLDMSGFNSSVVINLNAGEFSSGGQRAVTPEFMEEAYADRNAAIELTYGIEDFYLPYDQGTIDSVIGRYEGLNELDIYFDWGHEGVFSNQYENISIAYGVTIENAVGGDFRDIIVANEVDNTLTGNGGADVFIFQHGGHDTITDFVSGEDTIDLSWLGSSADIAIEAGEMTADFDGDGTADLTLTFANGVEIVSSDIFFG